jgi:hypothetical protein
MTTSTTSNTTTQPIPSSSSPTHLTSTSASSSSTSLHDTASHEGPRPKIGARKSSGTIIVPRDDPKVELAREDEEFDEDDARAMSPRRNSEDLEKMGQEARAQLSQYVTSFSACLPTHSFTHEANPSMTMIMSNRANTAKQTRKTLA